MWHGPAPAGAVTNARETGMRATIAAAAILAGLGGAQAHDTSPDACQVEDWRWWSASGGMLVVEGAATCTAGTMQLRLYDGAGEGRRFLGATTSFIEGHVFEAVFMQVDKPADLSIEYAITEGGNW